MNASAIGFIMVAVLVAIIATLLCTLFYNIGVYDGKHGTKLGKEC